jgi:hypothetical protein
MQHILLVFIVLVSVPASYSNEQAKAVHPQWVQAIDNWKAGGHYVTSFAFPGAGETFPQQPAAPDNMRLVSNIILRAENKAQAMELAKACPVLQYGGSVEVRALPAGIPVIY